MKRFQSDEFEKILANPRFISGVYNYCDRWCERCAFTTRCSVFALSEIDCEEMSVDVSHYEDAKDIIDSMTKFADSALGIGNMDEDMSMRDHALNTDGAGQLGTRQMGSPDYLRLAKRYISAVSQWFVSSNQTLKDQIDSLRQMLVLDFVDTDPATLELTLMDSLEVIQYYMFTIYVKLKRATPREITGELEADEAYSYDRDGSVKVALIAIDRSITAWMRLHDQLESENDTLDLLVILESLKLKVEEVFPAAREFRRPGIDETIN